MFYLKVSISPLPVTKLLSYVGLRRGLSLALAMFELIGDSISESSRIFLDKTKFLLEWNLCEVITLFT